MGGDWKELVHAIEMNDPSLVRYHLSNGVDPNYQHPEILTSPLLESIRFGRNDITKLLLENGADPNLVEAFGSDTPLSVAIQVENIAVIEMLKTYKADTTKLPRAARNQLKRLEQGKPAKAWWQVWG